LYRCYRAISSARALRNCGEGNSQSYIFVASRGFVRNRPSESGIELTVQVSDGAQKLTRGERNRTTATLLQLNFSQLVIEIGAK
jgi:hypothetical protein